MQDAERHATHDAQWYALSPKAWRSLISDARLGLPDFPLPEFFSQQRLRDSIPLVLQLDLRIRAKGLETQLPWLIGIGIKDSKWC